MASFGRVLEVLDDYRNALAQETQAEARIVGGDLARMAAAEPGAVSPLEAPLSNVHATGVGIRVRGGEPRPDQFVLKLFVFRKVPMNRTPALAQGFEGVPVDVEELPIQRAARRPGGLPPQQRRHRPVIGGLSIAPLGAEFTGTLGCFLRGRGEEVFALSNNHVIADVNQLPPGTEIVQPGPETAIPPTRRDAFAALTSFVPLEFPTLFTFPINQVDAAIAVVPDLSLIQLGTMFGIGSYTPQLLAPLPGMRVIKCGRTTGVTTGWITAIHVGRVQVNYGFDGPPRIAHFNEAVRIYSFRPERPFGDVGDSGSVILDERTGRPVALLYATDGPQTTACDLGTVCRIFDALPA